LEDDRMQAECRPDARPVSGPLQVAGRRLRIWAYPERLRAFSSDNVTAGQQA